MPPPLMPKKLKSNSSMNTYKTSNTKNRCPFYKGLECKSRKSRDTGSNRQVWPWSTKGSRAKANSFAKRTQWSEQTPSSTNTRQDSSHGHHQIVNIEITLIIFFVAEDGEAPYSQQKRPGAACGSNHELLIAKFRLKLKKVGKTTKMIQV